MISRVEDSVFWPGISPEIIKTRGGCSLAGVNYLILGDGFTGWLSIYEAGKWEFDAKGLVKKTQDYF